MAQTATTTEIQEQQVNTDKVTFGFWVYLMTDCVLFASLFATYAVLHTNVFGGPTSSQLFDLNFVLEETIILLTSSFTAGLAILAALRKNKTQVLVWLLVTLVLGLSFVSLELSEFIHLVQTGDSWRRSGFLTAYFTLVGTHGLHITVGSLWMIVLMVQIFRKGITHMTMRRLLCFSLFWHFLDIVWIFIFTIVYLMGVM